MLTPDTRAIEDLVAHCRAIRVITDQHPQLKPVALELLQMSGPLPRFEKGAEGPARGRRKMSAAQRAATSKRMKQYWAARKKEQKKA